MLDTVLYARDRFLKPGGAILPDIATMHLAGFSRVRNSCRTGLTTLFHDVHLMPVVVACPQEGAGLPFWDSVYGFDFSRVGREIRAETLASRAGRVVAIQGSAVVTSASEFKRFDLTTMAASDVEFNTDFVLRPLDSGACLPGAEVDARRCTGLGHGRRCVAQHLASTGA